jgi:hypothetical protein
LQGFEDFMGSGDFDSKILGDLLKARRTFILPDKIAEEFEVFLLRGSQGIGLDDLPWDSI